MEVGSGRYRYEATDGLSKLPRGMVDDVAGVAIDKEDRVYVFHRGPKPVLILDREGNLLDAWGDGLFSNPHSIRIGPDGMLYCVDNQDHTVKKLNREGDLLLTLGSRGKPSDTGAVGLDHTTVKRAAGPFNAPTDVAFGPGGDLFVSDGYGNARIHRFSRDGTLRLSWGDIGTGPGQFNVPHGIYIDEEDRVLVADRENSRIQIFTVDGEFIAEWGDARRPSSVAIDDDGIIHVTEQGPFPEDKFPKEVPVGVEDPSPRVTLRDRDGTVLSAWGGMDRCAPGNFHSPHMVAVDSRGDVYVAEVVKTSGAPTGCHSLQKFVKLS